MSESSHKTAGALDRRAAIKRAAGAAAAGIIWSAPRIEGLSLRPNYAAAGSTDGCITDFSGSLSGPSSFKSIPSLAALDFVSAANAQLIGSSQFVIRLVLSASPRTRSLALTNPPPHSTFSGAGSVSVSALVDSAPVPFVGALICT